MVRNQITNQPLHMPIVTPLGSIIGLYIPDKDIVLQTKLLIPLGVAVATGLQTRTRGPEGPEPSCLAPGWHRPAHAASSAGNSCCTGSGS